MNEFSWQKYETELMKRSYKVYLQEKEGGGIYGYSIKRGNSIYKSSVLGVGRNLTPSKIEATWAKLHPQERKSDPAKPVPQQIRTADTIPFLQPTTSLHPVLKHYDIATDEYHSSHVEISEAADNIIRQDCSLEEAYPLAKIEEIQHTALLLFAGYLDAATSLAASSGGGGSDTGGWGRDKDEDDLEWAAAAQEWQTVCANAGKDFTDKRIINRQESWELENQKNTPSINVDDMLKQAESSHEIEAEKQDANKRLAEIREAKEALLKIHQNLQDAIKAESEAAVVLKKAISNSNNIVNGICNAIVKAEQNTEFRATIKFEHFAQLQQLLNQSVKIWETILENHRSEQTKMLTDNESNMRKILRRNEGVWFSDFWMKVLMIFLFVYTAALGLVVYCVT